MGNFQACLMAAYTFGLPVDWMVKQRALSITQPGKGKIFRMTAVIFTGDVEACLQPLRWILRLSHWWPLRFCVYLILTTWPAFDTMIIFRRIRLILLEIIQCMETRPLYQHESLLSRNSACYPIYFLCHAGHVSQWSHNYIFTRKPQICLESTPQKFTWESRFCNVSWTPLNDAAVMWHIIGVKIVGAIPSATDAMLNLYIYIYVCVCVCIYISHTICLPLCGH